MYLGLGASILWDATKLTILFYSSLTVVVSSDDNHDYYHHYWQHLRTWFDMMSTKFYLGKLRARNKSKLIFI